MHRREIIKSLHTHYFDLAGQFPIWGVGRFYGNYVPLHILLIFCQKMLICPH